MFWLFFSYFGAVNSLQYISFFVIATNLIFLTLNVFTVYTLKNFFILSTLINFNFLLFTLSVDSLGTNSSSIFFIIVLNYLLCTIVFFFSIITVFSKDVKTLTDLRDYSSGSYANLLILLPVCSFAGVAPTLGFLGKFLLLVNSSNTYSFFLSLLFYFFIVVSTVFYFNAFKSFFNTRSVSIRKKLDFMSSKVESGPTIFFFIFFLSILILSALLHLNLLVVWYQTDLECSF